MQIPSQEMCGSEEVMICGWGECRVAVPSGGHLMEHITEHIQSGRYGMI